MTSLLLQSFWETIIMVGASALISIIVGVPLAILLCVTAPGGLYPHCWINHALGGCVNAIRSIYQPAIADIIQKFHVPISIIVGSLGHVREVAFGSMIVTLPAHTKSQDDTIVADILTYFQAHNISAEILGFIPAP